MKITLCGSMQHINAMKQASKELQERGYETEIPNPKDAAKYPTLPREQQISYKKSLIREHLDKISQSDAVLVFNEDKKGIAGYIGGNTLMEMAFAYAQNIEIFLFRNATELDIADEVYGMGAIDLNDKIEAIDDYFASLPLTLVSSKSPIKLRAVSRGLRRAGIRTRVDALPMQSNVNEQPASLDETYTGAMNRHQQLAAEAKNAEYLATIEGGVYALQVNHNLFETNVVIIEKRGGERKAGISVDVEYPKELTDLVPSHYPSLGDLAQQKYNMPTKDAISVFTYGKITRQQLLEDAVFNVTAQLPPQT